MKYHTVYHPKLPELYLAAEIPRLCIFHMTFLNAHALLRSACQFTNEVTRCKQIVDITYPTTATDFVSDSNAFNEGSRA